ncbi:putative Scavenger mRNA decapping enzyme [Monocercomonoides exilis]|uniref:putative Scavenger mRNA decapping enzyme n=1 Tax=Monocercomonoides exilis TaxID=2049356 RepID=UPI00355AAA3E|nr:putative Scavenger mRNA decapping enzyme [Monocercomonoides exilis]|eukprot:MONOS_6686.1-p1 / transcript=MONOS_6686.1 / gene=MONOS_6686 / organism=Monocercomonoides_exilis_PA203 / gene_product=GE24141 / transcript_product=GE24141 / location=Mono_scaffold00215:42509-43539(-) / protein_length=317 / sequence_SO=supercontig / SO=protein_coding / is_pseudo=false
MAEESQAKEIMPQSLADFKFEKILNIIPETQNMIVLATGNMTGKPEPALVFLLKAQFEESNIPIFFAGSEEGDKILPVEFLQNLQHNDKFYNFIGKCDPRLNPLFVKLIYPATPKDIEKYTPTKTLVLRETPEIYSKYVKSYIESRAVEKELKWVWNILDGISEKERVIYHDDDPETGFTIVPDTKWDERNMKYLYFTVLAKTRKIKSLRDINGSHIEFLKRMKEEAMKAAKAKYGVPSAQLLCYVHYLPSFMQLHYHVINIERGDMRGPRCILVDDIIDNLQRDPEYYQKSNLTIPLSETHEIVSAMKADGFVFEE